MKKYLILFALAVLVSCGKEIIESGNGVVEVTPISYDLSATHPDMTKAVKSGWEAGDAIFVFFDNVAAPKHLKMSYDGSEWLSTEYNGATPTPGALGLKNGDTGNMRAVFLPFGSNATVSASGTDFVFSKTYYTYYMSAMLEYTVTDNKVSGAFNMAIPDGYVQFFVEDAAATDEAYTLGCDAVIPTGVASIAANGTVNETSDKTAADDMLGYSYGGYLFSGKLTTWSYGSNYYFAKTNTSDGTRHDYFVTGKTLASHDAIKLPAASNSKWQAVGSGITVRLSYDMGGITGYSYWQTCNYGSSRPEDLGTEYTFSAANAIDGIKMPSKENFAALINHCSWTWLTIHGNGGVVVKSDEGFLFLPADFSTHGFYWTSTSSGTLSATTLLFRSDNTLELCDLATNTPFAVRERDW